MRRNVKLTIVVGRVGNGFCARTTAARAGVRVPGPVAAQRDVKDDGVVEHLLADITARIYGELGDGRGPCRGVGAVLLDVFRNLRARDPPDCEPIVIPQMRDDAPGLVVEPVTERVGVVHFVSAPVVRGLRRLALAPQHFGVHV